MLFLFNDTWTTEISTLSLHDALPISVTGQGGCALSQARPDPDLHAAVLGGAGERPCKPRLLKRLQDPIQTRCFMTRTLVPDRKSTRLNSSHANISYAVFCLKKT